MQMDDSLNADKLLGNLARDVLHPNTQFAQPFGNKQIKFSFFGLLAAYGVYMLAAMKLIFTPFSALSVVFAIPLFIISAILANRKNIILFNNYAPDLKDLEINYSTFGLIQTMISHILLGLVNVCMIVIVGAISGFSFSPFSMVIISLLFIFIYIKFSDIVSISIGYGMSVLPVNVQWTKFYSNIKRYSEINNPFSVKAAFVRVLFLGISALLVYFKVSIFIMIIIPVLYPYIIYPLEIRSTSSLYMRVRGRVNELVPGSVPKDLFASVENKPHPLARPSVKPKTTPVVARPVAEKPPASYTFQPVIANEKPQDQEYNYRKINLSTDEDDITPYAARTLDKIIQKVKQEGPLQKRGRYCTSCGVLTQGGMICDNCRSIASSG
ncbi:MAG: hypothetical protein INQ03_24640 [Candidatus Heimdallarchaeota archaeon]|nr:hypothetical protein [Candidatus Heimdallarchaeota archaeon]